MALTIHLNGQDALVTCRPHGALDARLTQEQPWYLFINNLFNLTNNTSSVGVLALTHIHTAHLALEAGEVETLPAAQGDFLMNRKICRHFERKISPTKTIMKN